VPESSAKPRRRQLSSPHRVQGIHVQLMGSSNRLDKRVVVQSDCNHLSHRQALRSARTILRAETRRGGALPEKRLVSRKGRKGRQVKINSALGVLGVPSAVLRTGLARASPVFRVP
jgi:hypothetical protein